MGIVSMGFRFIYREYRWWATGALYGYRAYKDTQLLYLAITAWDAASQYAVTEEDASRGQISTKNFTISGRCNGCELHVEYLHNDLSA